MQITTLTCRLFRAFFCVAMFIIFNIPTAPLRGRTAPVVPLASKVSNRIQDIAETGTPSAIHIDGWLGHRIDINKNVRLLTVEIEPLLAGFRQKPGSHDWIGEHVGKWMHAATLAWAYSGDAALRAKLDHVAAELIAAQESDGYLGTYVPEKRFGKYPKAAWDVWSHKYCLIGLLTYYQYTGNESALAASRKAADLLLRVFPAKKSIIDAGTHVGMAATSVLEPIVLLYRLTGDARYLEFAHYIVKSWDEPKGPAILRTLLDTKRVDKTANGKAYEMLSNLVGLCDLARVTGERSYIEASLNAWNDIVAKRLYITGATSEWEHFQDDHILINTTAANLGETCVTTTWIQFNLSLLQLTGDAKYGDELERAFYNHLAAAQNTNGDDWCYYTALEGRKKYDKVITCCHSSGPRGIALIPQCAYLHSRDGGVDTALVNVLETSQARMTLGGEAVTIRQRSAFPRAGDSTLSLQMSRPANFAVKVRVPEWALPARVDGREIRKAGWAVIPARTWKDGDQIPITFTLGSRLIIGEHGNKGSAAAAWGPFILACEKNTNPSLPALRTLAFTDNLPRLKASADGNLAFTVQLAGTRDGKTHAAELATFADAGADYGEFRTWLYAPGKNISANDSVLLGGTESRSRTGNVKGSILDERFDKYVTTFDGKKADEDWFAVTLEKPARARRFSYAHGKLFPNGGWFDTRDGADKPRIQIQRTAGGAWETVGELRRYPKTTAEGGPAEEWLLMPGRQFMLILDAPVEFVAVRVIGRPSCGNAGGQNFSSCAQLQAFNQ